MKKPLLIVLLLLCALYKPLFGQTDTLLFFNPTPNNTWFYKGDMINIAVDVTFISGDGNVAESYPLSALSFHYTVNGSPSTLHSVNAPVADLFHLQTTTININIPVISGLFSEGGGHVIIIWPVTETPVDFIPESFQVPETLFVHGNVSIDESDLLGIKAFPNPTADVLQVEVPAQAEVFLYNLTGQCVLSNQNEAVKRTLDLSTLPAGTYILAVRADDKWVRKPIVKL